MKNTFQVVMKNGHQTKDVMVNGVKVSTNSLSIMKGKNEFPEVTISFSASEIEWTNQESSLPPAFE